MTAVDVCCISQDNNFYNVKYLMYILASDDFQQKVKLLGRGTTRFRISKLNLVSIPFPLPPLAEQIRIVARLENLYSEIDKLKSDEYRLEELQKSFPKKMKDSILQYAIQGKLTDQLPEDGDARDLLKEIQKEKARLIKEGKIKNEKPLSDIDEEEIPYDIPDNWCWVRLGEITRIINGFTPPRNNPDFWSSKDISWFTVNDIRNQGHVITSTKEYISKTAVNGNARIVPAGSVLLCCTASIGEYAFTEISLTTNQQFNGITVKIPFDNHINAKYIYYYVQTLTEKLLAEAGKTTFPFLSTKKLADFIIPIAPFKEQTRIIKCIEMLLLQIDKLKND
jgi:type I restriction enzyme S subunit